MPRGKTTVPCTSSRDSNVSVGESAAAVAVLVVALEVLVVLPLVVVVLPEAPVEEEEEEVAELMDGMPHWPSAKQNKSQTTYNSA